MTADKTPKRDTERDMAPKRSTRSPRMTGRTNSSDDRDLHVHIGNQIAAQLDVIPEPKARPARRLWADREAIARLCKLTAPQKAYFFTVMLDERPYDVLGLTFQQAESLRVSVTYKISRVAPARFLPLFEYFDEIEFLAAESFTKGGGLTHSVQERQTVNDAEPVKLTRKYQIALERTLDEVVKADQAAIDRERVSIMSERESIQVRLSKELPELRSRLQWANESFARARAELAVAARDLGEAQARFSQAGNETEFMTNRLNMRLRDTAPPCIEVLLAELDEEVTALRKQETRVEERAAGKEVEIHSDRPSRAARIKGLCHILQMREELILNSVTSADAEKRIAELRAALPAVVLERIGIKGTTTYIVEVRGADGKLKDADGRLIRA